MKKIFFMAVSAVLLAAGCQKTEIQNEVIPQIGFKTHLGKLTKADADEVKSGEAKLKEQGFMVWGHIVTTDLNYDAGYLYLGKDEETGINLTYNNGEWGTEDIHYWPGKGKELDIYAVSMSETSTNTYDKVSRIFKLEDNEDGKAIISTTATSTLKVEDFIVEPSATNDLMIAPMIRQDQDDAEKVDLKFQHALTKVLVKFSTQSTTPVYVISATTSELKSKGTLNVINKLPESTVAQGDEPAASAEVRYVADITMDNWTTTDDSKPYKAQHVTETTLTGIVAGPQVVDEDDKPVVDGDGNPVYVTEFKAHKLEGAPVIFGNWLLIPQELTDETYLEVEYVIGNTYRSQKFKLKAGVVAAWDVNQQTTYNITITPDDITFMPEVEDWVVETGDNQRPANDEERFN